MSETMETTNLIEIEDTIHQETAMSLIEPQTEIEDSFGSFDEEKVCAPTPLPWATTKNMITPVPTTIESTVSFYLIFVLRKYVFKFIVVY